MAMAAFTLTSSRIVISIIVIASTLTAAAERVHSEEDDRRILKAMMGRCVEIFLNPSSPQPQPDNIVNADEARALTMYSCDQLFTNIGLAAGRFTLASLHQQFRCGVACNPQGSWLPKLRAFHNITEIPDKDYHALKTVMDSCVVQLLEQKDDEEPEWEWDLEYHENIRFCKGYFGYFLFFYDYEDRLTPEFIHVMRHFEKYYTLDWYPKRILLCLLTTKHSRQDCFHLGEDRTPKYREHILNTPPLLDLITDGIDLKS